MDKDKTARLVLNFCNATSIAPGVYQFNIDMGNFATNADELVYIQVDSIDSVIMSTSFGQTANPNTPIQVYFPLNLLWDQPQFNSYSTFLQGQTRLLCSMQKDYSVIQETLYAPGALLSDQEYWQVWKFKHKLEKIAMRPEVLQQKTWNIRLAFNDQLNGGADSVFNYIDFLTSFNMVLTISK